MQIVTTYKDNMLKLRMINSCALVAVAVSLGIATAGAQLPVSRTAALCPVSVTGGQFNFVGVPYVQDAAAAGAVAAVSGTTVTADALAAGDYLTQPHSLRVLNGEAAGQTRKVVAVSGNDITVTSPFVGLESGGVAEFILFAHPTLASVFGGSNAEVEGKGLLTTNASGTADVVYILSGGAFTPYFFREKLVFEPASAEGWRNATAGAAGDPDEGGAAIEPGSAVLVEKRGAGVSTLSVSGIVNSTKAGATISEGFSAVTQPFAEETTLDGSGLADLLNIANSSGSSDLVYLMDGTGNFIPYFFREKLVFEPASAEGWRLATAGGAGDPDEGGTVIPKGAGILIQRLGGTGSVEWLVSEDFGS